MTQNSMFNVEALDRPPDPAKIDLPGGVDLNILELGELLELRAAIQARLPMKLQDLDLENELVLQYQASKALMNKVMNDDDVPANQKAQVLNSCQANLTQLGKLQQQLFNAERLKGIEQALIRAVRTMPAEAQVKFFDDYERLYGSTTITEETTNGTANNSAVPVQPAL